MSDSMSKPAVRDSVKSIDIESSHHIMYDQNLHLVFQSDKHPQLPPNYLGLNFRDPYARPFLAQYACVTPDKGLARDIFIGLSLTIDEVKDKSHYEKHLHED